MSTYKQQTEETVKYRLKLTKDVLIRLFLKLDKQMNNREIDELVEEMIRIEEDKIPQRISEKEFKLCIKEHMGIKIKIDYEEYEKNFKEKFKEKATETNMRKDIKEKLQIELRKYFIDRYKNILRNNSEEYEAVDKLLEFIDDNEDNESAWEKIRTYNEYTPKEGTKDEEISVLKQIIFKK